MSTREATGPGWEPLPDGLATEAVEAVSRRGRECWRYAARDRDVPDLRLLAGLADIHTADAAIGCARQFFPDDVMSPRAERILAELFGGEQD